MDPLTKNENPNKTVSSMQFYSYRLMLRKNSTNYLLTCRQLLNQFAVDMYAKIESERLLYIRLNQKRLRVDNYAHSMDAMEQDANAHDIGKLVILPSTVTGSPRHMHEYNQVIAKQLVFLK